MDELELRIAALEMAFIELHAWTDRQAMDDAIASIAAGLGRGDADEDAIRRGAIQLIGDARDRFKEPAAGLRLRPGAGGDPPG